MSHRHIEHLLKSDLRGRPYPDSEVQSFGIEVAQELLILCVEIDLISRFLHLEKEEFFAC